MIAHRGATASASKPPREAAELVTRSLAVDRVKACAILAVIVTHAGPDQGSPQWSAADAWIRMTWPLFHVPAFLMMAGYLYATTEPMRLKTVWRRCVRVIVPYAVTMAVLYATGLASWPGWAALPRSFVLGESYGIFYFVPVLVACIAFGWLLSRMTRGLITALVLVLLLVSVVIVPAFAPTTRGVSFWGIRDPLAHFYFGFFACGWLGIPAAMARLRRSALIAATVVVLGLWIAVLRTPLPWLLVILQLYRTLYTLVVVGWLGRASWIFPGMLLLSETTLGLYLWHRPIMDVLVRAGAYSAPPVARIALLSAAGLGGAVLICLAARAALGPARARYWLGA